MQERFHLIEGKCPECHGNLRINDNPRSVLCEDCGHTEKLPRDLWRELTNKTDEWGTKDRRYPLTDAGKQLVQCWRKDEIPDSQEAADAWEAHRGILEDEGRLWELRKGGFIT